MNNSHTDSKTTIHHQIDTKKKCDHLQSEIKNILAFDCSSHYLHLYLKQEQKEYFEVRKIGLRHSERLLPLIDSLMREAQLKSMDLDLIACVKGPGSFTGLRIALATAKGIASATNIPIVSILTPDYLAQGAEDHQLVIPLIDARKKRYYSGIYRNGKSLTPPLDITPSDLLKYIVNLSEKNERVFLTGPDAPKALLELQQLNQNESFINNSLLVLDPLYDATRIRYLGTLAMHHYKKQGADSEGSGPLYIRKSEAEL